MEGQTLSHYKVLEKLGGGGMGVVYKALDTKLNRHVALKFLPPELTRDDEARERFMLEAQAASALDHPNICTIHEIDSTPDGQLFIAMGYYDGDTLKQKVAKSPLPIDEALDITVQVAQGLSKAHAAGIIHRDIKPANVIVTTDGLVKIVDFGIAKLLGVTGPTQTGTTLGTVSYMSPEQVAGEDADQQSDVWSLGAVLYEMLTGQQPFKGETPWAVMNAIGNSQPESPADVRSEIPEEVERVVLRALDKQRDMRVGSADELAAEARACRARLTQVVAAPPVAKGSLRRVVAPRILLPLLLVVFLLGIVGFLSMNRDADARWAREEALPQIRQLAESENYFSAFELAHEAERHIPNDSQLADLWSDISETLSFSTAPAGAEVFIREYADTGGDWILLGKTPIESERIPRGAVRWSIRKEGYEDTELALNEFLIAFGDLDIALTPSSPDSLAMTRVPVKRFGLVLGLTGFDWQERYPAASYLVDRYEVTNAEFLNFVDAGGYENPDHWDHEFIADGQPVTWREAMEMFRDSTGRPGPSTWEGGTYPPGQEDHPVSGVSWYEAAAYAGFRGKSLPSVYHWVGAAGTRMAEALAVVANFGEGGPEAVGSRQAVSPYGAHDMAGNVKEWCWNEAAGSRYILGGGWQDPVYSFTYPEARPPFDRSAMNGIRLIDYDEETVDPVFLEPIPLPNRDFQRQPPVSDDVFELFKAQYDYDPVPLNAEVEAVDTQSDYWRIERTSLNTAQTGERMTVYLYLPENVSPPYQTVVFFPGTNATLVDAFNPRVALDRNGADFIVKSGRALVWPIYKSTFERRDDLTDTWPNATRSFTDHVIQWVNETSITIDYLETREDIDSTRLGYYGISWGGRMGAIIPAVETRLSAAVLLSGALSSREARPEANQVNFAPRVTTPVLMLNGRHDFVEPVETAQIPLFELFGTPPADKKHVVFEEAGHWPLPRTRATSETLEWLDKYLGPVG